MSLEEIKARKAEIREQCKSIESNIVTDILSPSNIALGLSSFAINKFINKGQSNKKTGVKSLLSFKDSGGVKIFDTAMNVISNPIVSAFLSKTKKSWVHWQLFNIGFFIAKKIYNHYFYDKIEIIENPPPPKSTFQKITSGAKEYLQGFLKK